MRAFIRGVLAGYDTNSNLVRDPATGGVYAYDSERELTSATVSGRNATLAYDPLGRLDSYSATVFSRFVYDPMSATGAEAAAEVDSSGNIVRRFVRGDGADEILTEYAGATDASPTFMHADERGSVIAATDASATPLWINRYDEYGTPQAGNNGWFQYTGQQWLWEIGLYSYKARIYSPALGRFLQPDPVGYDAGPNVYAYVLDDPVNGVDPFGLDDGTCGGNGCGPPIPVTGNCEPGTHAVEDPSTSSGIRCVLDAPRPIENQLDPNPRGGPARGGRVIPLPLAPKAKPTPSQCRTYSLRRNGLGLGLDLLGIGAEGILSEVSVPAGVIATAAVGAAGIGNAIAHQDWAGLVLAYGGRHAGMAEGFYAGKALTVARGLSIVGLGLSTLRDFKQAKADYENCIAGNAGP